MNYQESLEYLYRLGNETLAMKFGLQNTEALLAAIGSPQRSFLKIQIAGTNGKGSVCAFLDAICRAAGLKIGLYTSPHLIEINERIRLDGLNISDEKFAELVSQVKNAAQKLQIQPTFFEHLTVIALLAFRDAKVDAAILETGLGGRLDSTTAAEAEIVGITPIALDHQEYLGETLAEIAAEKAAVIRPNTRVVVSNQPPEALPMILEKCREDGIIPFLTPPSVVADFSNVKISLRGRHQFENAATAIKLAEILRDFGLKISREAIIHGLETARHAGRLEFVDGILFDGAHNAAGAKALREFLLEFFAEKPLTIIFGAMRDKDLTEIGAEIFPLADNLILTRAENPRSATPADLHTIAAQFTEKIRLTPTVAEALRLAREISPPDNLILVTGSLYLVGEAQKILQSKN